MFSLGVTSEGRLTCFEEVGEKCTNAVNFLQHKEKHSRTIKPPLFCCRLFRLGFGMSIFKSSGYRWWNTKGSHCLLARSMRGLEGRIRAVAHPTEWSSATLAYKARRLKLLRARKKGESGGRRQHMSVLWHIRTQTLLLY